MSGRNVTRRLFVGVVGGSAFVAPGLASALAGQTSEADAQNGLPPTPENIAKLLAPLAPGKKLARWTIVSVEPMSSGSVRLRAHTADEHEFVLEILARDTSALAQRPPAETERYAVFVSNGGNGWTPTNEEPGLAAMALAEIIKRNEQSVLVSGFLTHGERIEQHRDRMLPTAAAAAAR